LFKTFKIQQHLDVLATMSDEEQTEQLGVLKPKRNKQKSKAKDKIKDTGSPKPQKKDIKDFDFDEATPLIATCT